MSEWDDITGFKGWSAKLRELLAEAQKISGSSDLDPRLELSERLADFVVNSEPNTADIKALDDIAKKASVNLLLAGLNDRIAGLAANSADLAGVAKDLENLATKNEAEAASIRLDKVHKTATALTDTIRTINELRAVLKEKEDAKLLGKLDDLLADIDDVRTAVGG